MLYRAMVRAYSTFEYDFVLRAADKSLPSVVQTLQSGCLRFSTPAGVDLANVAMPAGKLCLSAGGLIANVPWQSETQH